MYNFFKGNSVLDGAGFHPNDSFGCDPSLYSCLSSASGRTRILCLVFWQFDVWTFGNWTFFMSGTFFLPLPRASLQPNGATLYFIIKSQLSKSSSSSSLLLVIMIIKIIKRCNCLRQASRLLLITITNIVTSPPPSSSIDHYNEKGAIISCNHHHHHHHHN